MSRSAKDEEEGGGKGEGGRGNNSFLLGAGLISEFTLYIAFHFIEVIFFGLFRYLLSIFFVWT
jgi:hypothetical protein